MAREDPEEEERELWVFTAEALARAREQARERAAQTLDRRSGARDPPRLLSIEDGCRLVLFYAQKVPELCDLCSAPPEVRWTAVIFYRRFFSVRSPMEFDPLPMMFASVHLACKIEEAHEITLDKLLEAADFGTDESLKAKVASLELPLLDGIGYMLLVEPKPDTSLRMLIEELQHLLSQGTSRSLGAADALTEPAWQEVLSRAERLSLDLGVRTDAVLRWPASIVIAASLSAALDAQLGQPCGDAQALSDLLSTMLEGSLEAEGQRAAVRGLVREVVACARRLPGEVAQDAVMEAARCARRCHRAFERLREEATERHEAHRKERKRRWSEVKGIRRQVPTPILQDLAELQRRTAAELGRAAAAEEEFVIRRPREDREEERAAPMQA